MMFNNLLVRTALLMLACSVSTTSVVGQDLLATPVELWTQQLLPDANLGETDVLYGNGITMSPDGKMAFVTTIGATVYALHPYSGELIWAYQAGPVADNSIVRSHSSVVMSPTGNYMAYTVVDDENSLNPVT